MCHELILFDFHIQIPPLIFRNWVIKSEILYPAAEKDKPTKLCGVTGIHPRILTRARDHVVYGLLIIIN